MVSLNEVLAAFDEDGMTVRQLAAKLKLDVSALEGMLTFLVHKKYLRRGTFGGTPECDCGAIALRMPVVYELARPVQRQARDSSGGCEARAELPNAQNETKGELT
jgi:DNA-binding IclR family transcriptional regulator